MKERNNTPQEFYLYRYQLHINQPFQPELNIGGGCKTEEEIANKRQILMLEAVEFLLKKNPKNTHKYQLCKKNEDETRVLLTAEVNRRKKFVQNMQPHTVLHQPYAWIAIDSDLDIQTIAVAQESDLRHETVIKHLAQNLEIFLSQRGLHITVNAIYRKDSFWNFVSEHKSQLREVNFVIHPPNMSKLTEKVGVNITNLIESIDAKCAKLACSAKQNQNLHLEKNNTRLSGLVSYVQAGGGQYSFKLKGDKKDYKPKDQQKTFKATVTAGQDLFRSGDVDTYVLTKVHSQGIIEP